MSDALAQTAQRGEGPAVVVLGPGVVRNAGLRGQALAGQASDAGRMGGAAVPAGTRLQRAPVPRGSARRRRGATQRAWACGVRQALGRSLSREWDCGPGDDGCGVWPGPVGRRWSANTRWAVPSARP